MKKDKKENKKEKKDKKDNKKGGGNLVKHGLKNLFKRRSAVQWDEYLADMDSELKSFEHRIGHRFANGELLKTALTHPSFDGTVNYQRLEFLGDSLLDFFVAELLFEHSPKIAEGEMTRYRSHIVREASLAEFARNLGFGDALILGKGELMSKGNENPSILSDAYESVLAAIYLDAGIEPARKFVKKTVSSALVQAIEHDAVDFKTRLQEMVQKRGGNVEYRLMETSGNPQSGMHFLSAAYVNGREHGRGVGSTKKKSEQMAAKSALEKLLDASKEN